VLVQVSEFTEQGVKERLLVMGSLPKVPPVAKPCDHQRNKESACGANQRWRYRSEFTGNAHTEDTFVV
jgi:hypothetical protein